jgi:hypothetical protein
MALLIAQDQRFAICVHVNMFEVLWLAITNWIVDIEP